MITTLLVDGDIAIWRAASVVQETTDWGQGVISVSSDFPQAKQRLDAEILSLQLKLKATRMIFCLSDPKDNWRKKVLPAYKAHRKDNAKPQVFWHLRAYAEDRYDARWFPTLEADDVMGLYSTGNTIEGKRIIVSIDKDLQQIPGYLYNPMHHEDGIRLITEEAGDLFHLQQTITGDPQDGYKGIPKYGPKKAVKLLAQGDDMAARWKAIVAAYEKAGLTLQDALVQARVARILRYGEYNKMTREVTLWTPKMSGNSLDGVSRKNSRKRLTVK